MIFVKISSLAMAILHKCHLKARYSSVFYSGFLFLIICLACCSCGSTKVVTHTVRDIQKDTIYQSNIHYDSIYILQDKYTDRSKDTLLIKETNIEYRYKLLRDTIRIVQRDSIPYEVRITEVKQVKHISPWIKPLALIGGITILVLLIYTFTKLKRF